MKLPTSNISQEEQQFRAQQKENYTPGSGFQNETLVLTTYPKRVHLDLLEVGCCFYTRYAFEKFHIHPKFQKDVKRGPRGNPWRDCFKGWDFDKNCLIGYQGIVCQSKLYNSWCCLHPSCKQGGCDFTIRLEYFTNARSENIRVNVFAKGKHSIHFYPDYRINSPNHYVHNLVKEYGNNDALLSYQKKEWRNYLDRTEDDVIFRLNTPPLSINYEQHVWVPTTAARKYSVYNNSRHPKTFQQQFEVFRQYLCDLKNHSQVGVIEEVQAAQSIGVESNIRNMTACKFLFIIHIKNPPNGKPNNFNLDTCWKKAQIKVEKTQMKIPIMGISYMLNNGMTMILSISICNNVDSAYYSVFLQNIDRKMYDTHGISVLDATFNIDAASMEISCLRLLKVDFAICHWHFLKNITEHLPNTHKSDTKLKYQIRKLTITESRDEFFRKLRKYEAECGSELENFWSYFRKFWGPLCTNLNLVNRTNTYNRTNNSIESVFKSLSPKTIKLNDLGEYIVSRIEQSYSKIWTSTNLA
jgi:hypothetical protein